MSDISDRHAHDVITRHPDLAEMRARYERMLRGRQATVLDGLALLTGLYAAISPWVVHFAATQPQLAVSNLIIGGAIATFGVGLTLAPERMTRLGPACALAGVWLIISPWVMAVGLPGPSAGVIWSNVVVGALTFLLGSTATAFRALSARDTFRGGAAT